ncbi:MAG: uroporphyrinogen-III synthase [Asticcacaulis sp.]
MTRPPLVWVTRTQPQAEATAARLRQRDIAALIDPLLTVEPLDPVFDPTAVDHLIVTSLNALDIYAARHTARHQTVWAVGDATAQAAREAGFTGIHSASGDAGDLIRLLRAESPKGRLLWLRPETPARDLTTALPELDMTPALVYRTVVREAAMARAQMSDITHILLHSARAADACIPYLTGPRPKAAPHILCLSQAIAGRLREGLNFAGNLPPTGLNIEVAASPDEEALLARL